MLKNQFHGGEKEEKILSKNRESECTEDGAFLKEADGENIYDTFIKHSESYDLTGMHYFCIISVQYYSLMHATSALAFNLK